MSHKTHKSPNEQNLTSDTSKPPTPTPTPKKHIDTHIPHPPSFPFSHQFIQTIHIYIYKPNQLTPISFINQIPNFPHLFIFNFIFSDFFSIKGIIFIYTLFFSFLDSTLWLLTFLFLWLKFVTFWSIVNWSHLGVFYFYILILIILYEKKIAFFWWT